MRFSVAVAAAFAACVVAAPVPAGPVRRAVFSTKTFDQISISGGTAGTAEQDALAVFAALDLNDLANADKADRDFLGSVNSICNDAETGAYNPAIEAASGEAADALQRGKIQNKVLKLTATMLRLQIDQAQGKDVTAKMAAEQKKLNNNISQDKAEAGKAATKLSFNASTD